MLQKSNLELLYRRDRERSAKIDVKSLLHSDTKYSMRRSPDPVIAMVLICMGKKSDISYLRNQ